MHRPRRAPVAKQPVAVLENKKDSFRTDNLLFLDLRSREEYDGSHIRTALSFPPCEWKAYDGRLEDVETEGMESVLDHFLSVLREAHFDELIHHAMTTRELRSARMHKLGHLKEQAKSKLAHAAASQSIVLYADTVGGEDLQHLLDCEQLLNMLFDDEEAFAAFIGSNKAAPACKILLLESGFLDLTDEHRPSVYVANAPLSASQVAQVDGDEDMKDTLESPDELTVIRGSLYVGDTNAFLDHVLVQSRKSRVELFHESSNSAFKPGGTAFDVTADIFSLDMEMPIMPEEISLGAQRIVAPGMRLYKPPRKKQRKLVKGASITAKTAKRTAKTAKKKKDSFLKMLISGGGGGSSSSSAAASRDRDDRPAPPILVPDKRVKSYTYKFDNGYSYTWHHVPMSLADDQSILKTFDSLYYCMEGCRASGKPILIGRHPYAGTALVAYLVNIRRWPVKRAYKYVSSIDSSLLSDPQYVIQPLRLLIAYESRFLVHQWPSVPLKVIVAHQLGLETDLDTQLHFFRRKEIEDTKLRIFAAIAADDVTALAHELKGNPELAIVRTSMKDGDQTPLLACINSQSKLILQDRECLDLMVTPRSLSLTTSSNYDALFLAIRNGMEALVLQLLAKGAGINNSWGSQLDNPLQRAISVAMPLEILQKLATEETVNHRDITNGNSLHHIIKASPSSYSDSARLAVINMLVQHKVNVFAKDVDGRIPLELATALKLSRFVINHLDKISAQHQVYEPNNSFAPLRADTDVRIFVDGEETFAAMEDLMLSAKRSIYISDWWLTPEVYLRRTPGEPLDPAHQLQNVLKQKAEEGVQIRVLLWENVEKAMPIRSDWSKKVLEGLHANVKVLRHSAGIITGMFTHHQKILVVDEYTAFIGGLDLCLHRYDTQEHKLADNGEYHMFPGKDYFNARFIKAGKLQQDDVQYPLVDFNGLTERVEPRMPWHDVQFRVDGLAAFDVSRNFVQRWNFIKKNRGLKDTTYPSLAYPSSEGVFGAGKHEVQVVRSIASWSAGISTRECSVANAIKTAIREARRYIYIETQFFIAVHGSGLVDAEGVSETIADALINRVRRAFKENEDFKIVMLLPQYPEGDPADRFTQRIMFWQLRTIEHVEAEINELTRGHAKGASDFVQFFSLANHALLSNRIVSEQIYIHAKLLITDKTLICGSANLNMRSLVGDRDSEIAVVVHSPELAETLRHKLWREHLGDKVPLTGDFAVDVEALMGTARRNSQMYKNMLEKSTPMGKPRTVEEYQTAQMHIRTAFLQRSAADYEKEYESFSRSLRGHLVKFPRKFIVDTVQETDNYAVGTKGFLRGGKSMLLDKGLLSAITVVMNPLETFAFTMIDEQFQ